MLPHGGEAISGSGFINGFITRSLSKSLRRPLSRLRRDEKAVNRILVVALAMDVYGGLLALMVGAVLLGGSTERALKSGTFTQLDIQILDSKNLKIEHEGGEPVNLGESTGVYLQHNSIDYEISPDPPVVLEVANSIKLSLPEEVELKDGDSVIIMVKNERKNKIIYRKELLSGSSD
ncbi:hypothetical protein [Methanosarcina sp. DH2]|uniref:hypothetical protein n=1 Tax=Methanosarcina sp. DH2 TaxID=2605639 RepID=UPI001E2ADD15|nr:hypothetical protein [Methanosarcina sp. DH2]